MERDTGEFNPDVIKGPEGVTPVPFQPVPQDGLAEEEDAIDYLMVCLLPKLDSYEGIESILKHSQLPLDKKDRYLVSMHSSPFAQLTAFYDRMTYKLMKTCAYYGRFLLRDTHVTTHLFLVLCFVYLTLKLSRLLPAGFYGRLTSYSSRLLYALMSPL